MDTPETTQGKGFGPVISANVWLPTDLDFNYRFVEERAIVRPSATQFGEDVPDEFSLLDFSDDGSHAFLPRHLFDDCEELLPGVRAAGLHGAIRPLRLPPQHLRSQ